MPVLIIFKKSLSNIQDSPINIENLFLRTCIFNEFKLKLYSYEKEYKVVEDI